MGREWCTPSINHTWKRWTFRDLPLVLKKRDVEKRKVDQVNWTRGHRIRHVTPALSYGLYPINKIFFIIHPNSVSRRQTRRVPVPGTKTVPFPKTPRRSIVPSLPVSHSPVLVSLLVSPEDRNIVWWEYPDKVRDLLIKSERSHSGVMVLLSWSGKYSLDVVTKVVEGDPGWWVVMV